MVRTPQETAAELVRALMNRGMVTRTERKYKRPKPGRTRLVKWPRTLMLVKVRQGGLGVGQGVTQALELGTHRLRLWSCIPPTPPTFLRTQGSQASTPAMSP